MTRRRSVRKPRRVQVQFWRRGEAQASPGYTTNISTTGMFLATTSPQPPGTRLRIEVMDGSHGFIVEGLVVHARKVRGDMMRITHPGMGIRFLSVAELVRELIPILPGETEEIPEEQRLWGEEGSPSLATSTGALKPPPAGAALPAEPVRPVQASPAPPAAPPPGGLVSPGVRATGSSPKPAQAAGAFTVQFLGPAEFVQVFERDIVNGGLFVSTRYPGRLQEVINVEILPPLPHAEPVAFRARVVQRFEPHGNDFGPNLLAGMGVEIIDLPALLARLLPEISRARSL
jgi:hypothetical protein